MEQLILIIHILTCFSIIGFVLIQHGKGAEAGAAFGGGASQTVFGSQGSGTFLSKTTAILATIFFVTNILLGNINTIKNTPNISIGESFEKIQIEKAASKDELPSIPE